jgi:methyl-accepting chemotaxis protein
MKWNVGTKISAGFAVTLIIFLLVGTVAYRSTTQLVETSAITQHTLDVLGKISGLNAAFRDMEVAQRSYLLTTDADYLRDFEASQQTLNSLEDELRRLTADNQSQQERLGRLDTELRNRIAIAQEGINARRENLEAAIAIVRTRGKAASAQTARIIADMQTEENRLLEIRSKASESSVRSAKATLIYGVLAAIVLAGVAAVLITRNIAGPLGNLTIAARRITLGDLRTDIPLSDRTDEVGALTASFDAMTNSLRTIAAAATQVAAGDLRTSVKPQSADDQLGNAFARMLENLRVQISSIRESANVLGSAASEIVASTSQLAAGASQSAAAVSETTATVEEVRQTAQMASDKAKLVSDSAQRAVQYADDGRKATSEMVTGMTRIRQQMEAIGESMMRLSEQGQSIAQIIATVEDLAAQSNLLAVNAAIEAAKAGDYGKGFSVVAQEVKSLSEQSRQATDRVRTILGDIQKATTAAVLSTEQGSKAVEAGDRQSESAGESIQNLAGTVTEAAQTATQIAASSQQQLVGMDQVVVAMDSIKQASTQNVASARQLEVSARSLNDMGQRLKQIAEQYSL